MHYNNNRATIAKYKFHLALKFGVQNYIIKTVQSTTREGTIYREAATLGRERTAEELSHTLHNPTPTSQFPLQSKKKLFKVELLFICKSHRFLNKVPTFPK